MSNLQDGLNALELLQSVSDKLRLEEICKLTREQKARYDDLLDEFIKTNSSRTATNQEKGKSLEDLSSYLLQISGGLFEICRNLRSSTNEIDLLMQTNTKGKVLCKNSIINEGFDTFISECKNHNRRIGVSYTGKFCSLLLSTQTRIGIIFSYYGITGSGWRESSGLVKKFYLHKEKVDERFCIIDFNITDFKRIKQGDNFFQIINEKMNSLRFDTDYTRFLSTHPAEGL